MAVVSNTPVDLGPDALELVRTLLLEELKTAAEILADQAHEAAEVTGSIAGVDASATLHVRVQQAAGALDAIGWVAPDAERREARQRNPDAYDAMEQLHDAYDGLRSALDEQVNATGVLFSAADESYRTALAEKGAAMPTPERLVDARERVQAAEAEWALAVARADAMLGSSRTAAVGRGR